MGDNCLRKCVFYSFFLQFIFVILLSQMLKVYFFNNFLEMIKCSSETQILYSENILPFISFAKKSFALLSLFIFLLANFSKRFSFYCWIFCTLSSIKAKEKSNFNLTIHSDVAIINKGTCVQQAYNLKLVQSHHKVHSIIEKCEWCVCVQRSRCVFVSLSNAQRLERKLHRKKSPEHVSIFHYTYCIFRVVASMAATICCCCCC